MSSPDPTTGTPPPSPGVPVVDITRLVGDMRMQADLLRADATALATYIATAQTRMRHAAAMLDQVADVLNGAHDD